MLGQWHLGESDTTAEREVKNCEDRDGHRNKRGRRSNAAESGVYKDSTYTTNLGDGDAPNTINDWK